jgi:hypothetical protein
MPKDERVPRHRHLARHAALLAGYGVVVLGDMPERAQASTFSTRDAGGNLIAMHPDADLASLPASRAGTTLAGYVQ